MIQVIDGASDRSPAFRNPDHAVSGFQISSTVYLPLCTQISDTGSSGTMVSRVSLISPPNGQDLIARGPVATEPKLGGQVGFSRERIRLPLRLRVCG